MTIDTAKKIKEFIKIDISAFAKKAETILKEAKQKAKNILRNNKVYIVQLKGRKGGYNF